MNDEKPVCKPFPPNGLTRSGIACWWSILNLIQDSAQQGIPCYMWTLTFPKVYPDSWCGNMHRNLVRKLRDEGRAGRLGPSGLAGVRVTEIHPNGHGIHFHWVIRGRLPLGVVRRAAKSCGFGHVFIARDARNRFRKVDAGAAGYVAKYLGKGDKLAGVRSWACIGDYNGTKTKDIEFDSQQNRVFRAAYRTAKLAGSPAALCYGAAVVASRQFAHNADDRDQAGGVGRLSPRPEETGFDSGVSEQLQLGGIPYGTVKQSVAIPLDADAQRDRDLQLITVALLSSEGGAVSIESPVYKGLTDGAKPA